MNFWPLVKQPTYAENNTNAMQLKKTLFVQIYKYKKI